jgi:hypothetical protein
LAFIALLTAPCARVFAQMDFTGEGRSLPYEDTVRRADARLGKYFGLPVNDAARLRAESWDASLQTLPEYQCRPHPMQYAEHGAAMSQERSLIPRRSS